MNGSLSVIIPLFHAHLAWIFCKLKTLHTDGITLTRREVTHCKCFMQKVLKLFIRTETGFSLEFLRWCYVDTFKISYNSSNISSKLNICNYYTETAWTKASIKFLSKIQISFDEFSLGAWYLCLSQNEIDGFNNSLNCIPVCKFCECCDNL